MNPVETIPQTEIDKPVSRLFASDAERIMKPTKEVTLPDYERGTFEKAYVGALDTITSMGDLPEAIEIFGDRISYGFSQYFGSDIEAIDRKKSNLVTAERNLLNQQKERYRFKSPTETDSLSYAIGSGAVSYGSMLFTSGLGYVAGLGKAGATALGITAMTAQEFPSQVSSRTPIKDGEVDIAKITPEWAMKTTASQIGYHASSAILERYVGLGQQLNTWTKPIQLSSETMSTIASAVKRVGTSAIKSGVSEGTTEGLQSLTSSGFLLADGTIDMNQMPDQIKSAMKDAVVGGLLGTAAGTAVGINQRANVLKSLHEVIDPVVGDIKTADTVVNEIYKTGTAEMTTVISKELELSSELTSKHGLIMDNMGKAIHEAINAVGAFENVSETEVAEYVMDTSKLFADQVLAEANKRSVLIDGVLSGSQITFKNGKIQLANGENIVAENDLGDIELKQNKFPEVAYGFVQNAKVSGEETSIKSGEYYRDLEKIGYDFSKTQRENITKIYEKKYIEKHGEDLDTGSIDDYLLEEVQGDIYNNLYGYRDQWFEDLRKELKDKYNIESSEINESRQSISSYIDIPTEFDEDGFETSSISVRFSDHPDYHQETDRINVYYSDSPIDAARAIAKNLKDNFEYYSNIQDNELYQGNKKGSFNVSQQAIELTKDADFSTLPHEFAHYWLTNMYDFTRTGKASEAYLKNFEAVKNYLGIQDNQKFLTRTQQEKFATGYEKYLRQGNLPNRIIGQLYDDYDKWLKRVYAQVPRNRLTPEMVEFFKTMTTGQLIEPSGYEPTPELIRTTKERIAKDGQEVITARQADIAENVVIPTTTEYKPVEVNRVPITSDNQTGESAVFKKHAEEMGSNAQLKYDVANMEEQAKLADEYLKANPQDSVDIVYGRKEPPKNILANSIRNAYIKQMLEVGNNEEYIKALKIQSFELTRAGQEIASQRGVVKDIYDPTGWIMQVIEGRKQNISADYDKIVDKAISDNIEVIQSKETVEEQQKEINRVIKSVAKELGTKPEELYQNLNERLTGKNSIYTAMRTQVDDALGVNLTKEEAGQIIAQTDSLKKNALNSIDKNGNPSVEFFRILNDTEKLANSLNPTNRVAVLTSIVGRGNMLASIKSTFLNIESNFLNSVTERLTRRAVLKLTSDVKIDNQVSPELAKQYMKYSSDVYKASGYTVSGMFEIDPKADFKGEKFMHSQGSGVIRKIGQMVEQTIFKYSLGYNDRYMKDLAFVDSVGLEATKQARIEKAKDVKARANEIFQDAIKIEPKTAQGVKIRETAVNEALVATYMNNTKLAEKAIQIRDMINQATGALRVGDLISPFVKTPANVVSLGLEYSLGGVQALKNLDVIVNDFKTGNITDTTRNAIRSTSRNALGLVASMLIMAGFIDDEDYIPDYSVLSPAERKMVQQKNGVFNSIRIGDKYISLDYFGALAAPLVAALEFRRAKGLTEGLFGYGKGVALQVMKLPVIGDLKDIYADISTNLTRTGDKTFEGLGEWGIDLLSARTIPAFVNDIAKQLDTYERDTGGSALNRAISKIPVLRENLPPKYNFVTGEPVKVEAYNFLFGARLKTGNFSNEMSQIEDIVESGNNVTLSDPTRYGKLRDLPEVDKIRIRAEFADDYSSAITKEMAKGSWDKKSNEDKAKTLNELRSKILKKYKN